MGPRAWGQGFPHSLCFSSSLKYLCCLLPKSCLTLATPWTVVHQAPLSRGFDNSIWCTFPVLFCRCKPPPLLQPVEGANYLMTLSPYTQAFWNLKTDKVNPCDPTLLPHHQPVRELCTSWSHTLWPPLTSSPGFWKSSACQVASVVSNSLQPYGLCPPGSSVYGILQTRILEWVAMPSSRGSSQPRNWTCVFYISQA